MDAKKPIEGEIISSDKTPRPEKQAPGALAAYDARPFFTQVWEQAEEIGLLPDDFEMRFEREFGLLQNKFIKLRNLDIFDPNAMMDARMTVKNLLDIGLLLASGGDRDKAAVMLGGGEFNKIARLTLDRVKEHRLFARELRQKAFLRIPVNANIIRGLVEREPAPVDVPLLWGTSFIDPLLNELKLDEFFAEKKLSLFDCIKYISTGFDRGETVYDDGKDMAITERMFQSPQDLDDVALALGVADVLLRAAHNLNWEPVFNLSGLGFERPQEAHPYGWFRTASMTLLLSMAEEKPSITVLQSTVEKFINSMCDEFGEVKEIAELAEKFVEYIGGLIILDERSEYVLFKWAIACATSLEQIMCEIQESILIEETNESISQFYNRFFIEYGREEFFEFNIKPLSDSKELLLAQLAWAQSKNERRKILDSLDIADMDIDGIADFLHDAGKMGLEYIEKVPVEKFSIDEMVNLLASADLSDEILPALASEMFRRVNLTKWELPDIIELYRHLPDEERKKLKSLVKAETEDLVFAVGNEYEYERLQGLYAVASPEQLFELLVEFCDIPSASGKSEIDSPNKKALLNAVNMLSEKEACKFFYFAEKHYLEIIEEAPAKMEEFLEKVRKRPNVKPPFSCKSLTALFTNIEKPLCTAVKEYFINKPLKKSPAKTAKVKKAAPKKKALAKKKTAPKKKTVSKKKSPKTKK